MAILTGGINPSSPPTLAGVKSVLKFISVFGKAAGVCKPTGAGVLGVDEGF